MAEVRQQKIRQLAEDRQAMEFPEEFQPIIRGLERECRKQYGKNNPDYFRCREYTDAGISLFFTEENFEVKKVMELCEAGDPHYKECVATVRRAYETLWLSTQQETIENIARAMGIL